MASRDRFGTILQWAVVGVLAIDTPIVGFMIYRMITRPEPSTLLAGTFVIACYMFLGFAAYMVCKESIMTLGVFERIRERRRMAMAAAVAEKYKGIDLFDTTEARAIPKAHYRCGNDACYSSNEADNMYWIDTAPLSAGWYCLRCTEAMRDMDKSDRLNLEVFLMVLDYETGQIDKK